MSAKILKREKPVEVAPFAWRFPGDAPTIAPRQTARKAAEASAADTGRDVESEIRAAYQAGFQQGEAAGKDRASAQVQPVIEKLGSTLAAMSDLRIRIRRDAESDLVKLSIAIARRILNRELTVDPGSIHALIKVALEKLQAAEITRVRIHPSQVEQVRGCLARLAPGRSLELFADARLQVGDAVFETSQGNLDASVESQLSEIERGFADRLLK